MEQLKRDFRKPDIAYRNEVRWWLSEGLHTDKTLKNEVKMLDESGFGAAEFLAMGDYGVDVSRYGWGSEEFVHDTQLILDETTKRGMGASMTSGTNWSNANLNNIVPDDKAAAKELSFAAERVNAGERYSKKLEHPKIKQKNVFTQTLVDVVAMKIVGSDGRRDILAKTGVVLTGEVKDEFLNWKAPADGDYLLFTVWLQGTGQTASPSCSINYTINYIDKYGTRALIDYWNECMLTPDMRKTILKNGRVQLYMDSLELSTYANGGQFWGYDFMDEFKARRGYSLSSHLPLIFKKASMMMSARTEYLYACEDEVFSKKLKNDLYQTMTDMYMENVLEPIQTWLHGIGMTLRAEISYGLPFEISQPGKFVDGIETESLEFASQIDSYRGLAGAAHLYGRLYSSETGALLGGNYQKTLDFYTQIIYTQFAAGVARTVLHGYASICGSEGATRWPGHEGMLPIFSERFGSRQPAYRHYNDWNDMISRYQYILRQGKPRMDIGMLRLDYAFNNMMAMTGETETYEKLYMRANEGVYWKNTDIQNAGYTYDYFAPQILKDVSCDGTLAPDGPGYQAIIIYQDALDADSAKALLAHAKKGLKVLFVNGVTEMIAPGMDVTYEKAAASTPFNDGRDAELAELVAEIKALANAREINGPENALAALRELGVEPRVRFAKPNRNVLPLSRDAGDKKFVYLYNCMYTETEPVTFTVEALGEGMPRKLNCLTGEIEPAGVYDIQNGRTVFDVTLRPGEACAYVIDCATADARRVISSNACFIRSNEGKNLLAACESGEYFAKFSCGCVKKAAIKAPKDIAIEAWNLKVESWNAGKKAEVTEDRGLGYVTKEVYYETEKEILDAGVVTPKSWKNIPEIGENVSGIGFYSAEFTLPDDWSDKNIAIFDLGCVNGQTSAVFVNGAKAPAIDPDNPKTDISALVKPGKNVIEVEVSSTLTNVLISRGYYKEIPMMMGMIMSDPTIFGEMPSPDPDEMPGEQEGGLFSVNFECAPVDSGMTGKTIIRTYGTAEI